ncbi:MAG: tRNA (adenosine(37)-N6)-threonylcarbamoyltransferase complex dimerization subunit type 1 TsaB [Chitinophagaceae bacterium]|nr:MAG: tRNA (adenosine(37)-N6)-threonylcarbamoyltransferase complex dimerization subunit type 1 TsaB [Chitinophagaceae bacterium]
MAIILHIDTAVETASICLADNDVIKGYEENGIQKEHSSWLHPSINNIFNKAGIHPIDIDAVSVTIGPGSYTGLRVGLSAAKGLCFSLDKPLISINTLELMANDVKATTDGFIIPVIDARRMEVFTAVYDHKLMELEKPGALILDEHSYRQFLGKGKVVFTGNAVHKVEKLVGQANAEYRNVMPTARSMVSLAAERQARGEFCDIAYLEPLYVKEFYQATP